MKKVMKFFLLFIFAVGSGLLFYSCQQKNYATLVPDIITPHDIRPIEKLPYKIAFVVDGESLNKIYEVNYANMMIIYSAMGRALSVTYKELLDKHFEDVVMVWSDNTEVIRKCDLKTKIIIDEYYAEVPLWVAIADGTLRTTVTYVIERVNGPVIVKRKMTDIETGKYMTFSRNRDIQWTYFQNTVNMFTTKTVNNMLSKFSLELQASPKLHIFDFKDMEGFLKELSASNTPLSKFLFSKLSPNIQEEVHKFAIGSDKDSSSKTKKKTIPIILKTDLIDQLNNILVKETLRDVSLKTNIKMPEEKSNYTRGLDRFRINRQVLEQTYSQYIEKLDTSIYEKLKSLPESSQQRAV